MGRKVLRIGLLIVGIALLLAGIAAGAFRVMNMHFNPDPPKADYTKPASALEAQRQDLDYFAKLVAMDHAYSPSARAEASRRIATMAQAPAAISPQEFMVRLMQITALADNGHTHLRLFAPDRVQPNVLPIRVSRFANGFYVMRAKAPFADMLGGRVESIDGVPFDKVLPPMETLRGGTADFRRENVSIFVVIQDILFGLGIARDPDKSTWIVRLPSGAVVTHVLTATTLPKDDPFDYGDRWLSPDPRKGMGPDWRSAVPAAGRLPISRQNIDRLFVNLPAGCARYIRIEDIVDTDGQKIAPFLTDTEAQLKAHPPCAAIVDLRGNGGGDYTNAWHFGHALPGLLAPGGHIYVLTDPNTFSAAITTTAFLKETGDAKVVILGEPIGDRLAFYAEGGQGCLPNSKLCATYETGKHDYGASCNDWNDCYWLNWFYPVRVKSLQPDEFISQRFADWNAGHDPAYDRAVELAGKK